MGKCVRINVEHVRMLVATTPEQRPLTEADITLLSDYFAVNGPDEAVLARQAIERLIQELKVLRTDALRYRCYRQGNPWLDSVCDELMRMESVTTSMPW